MRWLAVLVAAAAAVACGNSAAPGDASAPPAPGAASAMATVAKPASLARTVTPRERRETDERACEGGEAAACRRAADRHRGYGHAAGCGVERARPKPYRIVTAADAESDARAFDKWIRKACALGDEEACLQGKNNVQSHRITERDVDVCARGKLDECPLYLWQSGMRPDAAKKLAEKRVGYLRSGVTAGILGDLYRKESKEKAKAAEALPKEMFELAERVCKSTLECDDVIMMLDKNGYGPGALAPLKKSMAEALAHACLAGDCVCGEAASYLEASDPRALDLARIGCDDGEPDACWLLGRVSEESDPKNAVALYSVACPAISAADDRQEIYSKRACDRLAELSEEGRLVDKDSDRAFFYSTLACKRSGFEREHTPCVRRALYHARGYLGELRWGRLTSSEVARDFLYGTEGPPVEAKECQRPSAQVACKRDEPAVLAARGQ